MQDKGAIEAAKRKAEELGARVEYASKHDLNMVADNRPHQVWHCMALYCSFVAGLLSDGCGWGVWEEGGRVGGWVASASDHGRNTA